MKKKEPLRKCVVTFERKSKKELVRIVRNSDQSVSIDPTGKKNGRGAYVSLDVEVAKIAKQKNALAQALNAKVTEEFYDELIDYIDYQIARRELLRQNEK
ncbi:RNase P modulator RnpM [Allofustis seminis]|uniref:RNase P modulator RnpM n=1 Tax=Allofustis seminis TaxID=166939 RepID=UPI0003622B3C|nr:YlxR family protein [Allofustis seminis]